MTLTFTKNVAKVTMMTHFDSTYRELSDGASPNSHSQIEMKVKRFENLTLKYTKKRAAMATF